MIPQVLGFRFSESEDQVVLIRKNRPEWQRNKLNGVGGKTIEGEGLLRAMVREFKEEVNISTRPSEWLPFATLSGKDFYVMVYKSFGSLRGLKSNTDEIAHILPVSTLSRRDDLIPNISFLIPLALNYEGSIIDFKYT